MVPYRKPYTVHLVTDMRGVRRYICRRATVDQALYAADKLLRGAPNALVEIFKDGYAGNELVACIGGGA